MNLNIKEKRRKALRVLAMALSALMVVLVGTVFVLILRSERAYDEAACPFALHNRRALYGVQVREEARSCLAESEEHRWLVERPGGPPYEFARTRLPKQSFRPEHATWTLEPDAKRLLVLKLTVDGRPVSEFHEADVPEADPAQRH